MSTSWLRFWVVTLNSARRILGTVNAGTPSDRELDGYRAGADRFIAELDEEYYLHYAGLKPEFELRPIYERHADLIDLEHDPPRRASVRRNARTWSSSGSAAKASSVS